MPTGGGAAYKQLTNSPNYLGKAITDNNQAAAKVRADKLLAEADAKLAADKAEALKLAAEKTAKDSARDTAYGKLEGVDGQFDPSTVQDKELQSTLNDYALANSDAFAVAKKAGQEAFESGDTAGFNKAQDDQRKLMDNYSIVQKAGVVAQITIDEYLDTAENVSPVDEEHVAMIDSLLKENYEIVNDENNIPRIHLLLENQDGVKKWKKTTLQQFIKQEPAYTKFDITDTDTGFVNQFAKGQKLNINKTEDGVYNINTTGWSQKNTLALTAEIKKIHRDKKKMSSALFQATGLKKKGTEGDEFTEDDKLAVSKYLTDQVMGRVDKKYEKTTDNTQAAANKTDQEKENERYDAERVTGQDGQGKGFPQSDGKGGSKDIGKKYVFENKNKSNAISGVDSDQKDAELISATLYEGKIIAEFRKSSRVTDSGDGGTGLSQYTSGGKKGGKEVGTKSERYSKTLSDTEMGRLALSVGVNNAAELKTYLEGRDNNTEVKSTSKYNKK